MERTASPRARAWFATAMLLVPMLLALAPAASATAATGWSELTLFAAPDSSGCVAPSTGGDSHGTLFAAADCTFGSDRHVMASMRPAGGDWSLALPLDLGSTGTSATDTAMDVGPDGTATVAWFAVDSGDGQWHTFGSVYVPESGWTAAQRLDTDAPSARYAYATLSVSAFAGGGFVSWGERITANSTSAVAAIRQTGGTWGTPARIAQGSGVTGVIYLGADGAGHAKFAFPVSGPSGYDIQWAQYTDTGWSAPALLVHNDTMSVTNERIGVGRSGAATVSFLLRPTSGPTSTWEVHTTGSGAWSQPQRLSSDDGNSTAAPRAFVDESDGFAWAWVQGPTGAPAVYASRGSASVSPSAPENVVGLSALTAYISELAGTASGRLLLAVTSNAAPYYTWACTYDPATGWADPAQITSAGSAFIGSPPVSISRDGLTGMASVRAIDGLQLVGATSFYAWPDRTAPALAITAPADGSATADPTVLVNGTTEPGATVQVAGAQAAVDSAGRFSVRVVLSPGANAIAVSSTDASGNQATAGVTVTFNDPTAGLEAQLQELASSFDLLDQSNQQLQANYSALEAQLAAKEDAIRALTSAQVALGAQANATDTELAGLQSLVQQQDNEITGMQAQIDALTAQLNTTGGGGGSTGGGSDTTALLVGALGAALGAVALAVAVLLGRRGAETTFPEKGISKK